jgi:hypothetical protein
MISIGFQSFRVRRRLVLGLLLAAIGCDAAEDGAFVDHEESSDFDPFDAAKADGVASVFNRHDVVDDAFFVAAEAVDVAAVQAFLEHTPYGRPCFLADAVVGNTTPAAAIVAAAKRHDINPILLLSRMQVEKGLISKSKAPSQKAIDFAFGCGCADGNSCSEAFRGFDKQIECAADTMREHFDAAQAGMGIWRVGVGKKSLDGLTVTPANAATASLYAYTPWVLTGKGGNWLVWNVTGKFVNHFESNGGVDIEDPGFVGTPCEASDEAACGFAHDGDEGFCLASEGGTGVCTVECEGRCPDKAGSVGADTMCVELEPGVGGCVPVAGPHNDDCGQVPGSEVVTADRFVGDSGVGARTATVCWPEAAKTEAAGPSCVDHCGEGTAHPDGHGNACFCDDACVANGDCCGDFAAVCE